jgi:hypothetical protein
MEGFKFSFKVPQEHVLVGIISVGEAPKTVLIIVTRWLGLAAGKFPDADQPCSGSSNVILSFAGVLLEGPYHMEGFNVGGDVREAPDKEQVIMIHNMSRMIPGDDAHEKTILVAEGVVYWNLVEQPEKHLGAHCHAVFSIQA